MVLTIFEPWPNYKILALHALKLFKFESGYLKKENCGSQKKLSKKISVPKNLGSKKSFVKIGSVTAEIMPIWTNVTWPYVS